MSSKSLINVTIDQDYIVNYILPSVVEYVSKNNKIIDKCNSFEEYKEYEISVNFLKKFLDFVIYVKQLYDKKEMKKRIIKLNNIENLLYINGYLTLFCQKKDLNKMYWNKNINDKNYIIYSIVLHLSHYLYDLIE